MRSRSRLAADDRVHTASARRHDRGGCSRGGAVMKLLESLCTSRNCATPSWRLPFRPGARQIPLARAVRRRIARRPGNGEGAGFGMSVKQIHRPVEVVLSVNITNVRWAQLRAIHRACERRNRPRDDAAPVTDSCQFGRIWLVTISVLPRAASRAGDAAFDAGRGSSPLGSSRSAPDRGSVRAMATRRASVAQAFHE